MTQATYRAPGEAAGSSSGWGSPLYNNSEGMPAHGDAARSVRAEGGVLHGGCCTAGAARGVTEGRAELLYRQSGQTFEVAARLGIGPASGKFLILRGANARWCAVGPELVLTALLAALLAAHTLGMLNRDGLTSGGA